MSFRSTNLELISPRDLMQSKVIINSAVLHTNFKVAETRS